MKKVIDKDREREKWRKRRRRRIRKNNQEYDRYSAHFYIKMTIFIYDKHSSLIC